MRKVLVLYYSRTGNTEKMANAVAEGAKVTGKVEVELSYFVEPEDLVRFEAMLVGTPTYNHDVPLTLRSSLKMWRTKGINLKGKIGATFGSYGWSGEAPKIVLEIMKNKFGMRVIEPPAVVEIWA